MDLPAEQCARFGCGHSEDRHDASRPGRPCEDCDPASGCRAWTPLAAMPLTSSLMHGDGPGLGVSVSANHLADVQHGVGAWIREAVARETAGLTARLDEVTADRDYLAAKLAETMAANQRWAETLADVQQRHAEGKERGLPPDDYEPGSVVIGPGEQVIADMPVADAAELASALRERDAARAVVAEMIAACQPAPRTPTAASAHLGRLAEWGKRAGLPPEILGGKE